MLEKSTRFASSSTGASAPQGITRRIVPTRPSCIRSRSSSVSRLCGTTPKNSRGASAAWGSSGDVFEPQPATPRARMPAAAAAANRAFIRGKASYRAGRFRR